MNNKNQTREDILAQIKYLEQSLRRGSVAYQATRVNKIHSLKSSLRNACWNKSVSTTKHVDWKTINNAFYKKLK